MSTCFIHGIGYGLGHRVPVSTIGALAAQKEQLDLASCLGFSSFCRAEGSSLQLAARAVEQTFQRTRIRPEDIDFVMFASTSSPHQELRQTDFYRFGREALTRMLNVSGPFHCSLMATAQTALSAELAQVEFQKPRVPVLDAAAVQLRRNPTEIADALAAQVCAPVRWDLAVASLAALAVETVVEVGCGSRLTSMIRRGESHMGALAFQEPADLPAIAELAERRPFLKRPIGQWQLQDGGHLFAAGDTRATVAQVVWAGQSEPEAVDERCWRHTGEGSWMRKFGRLALLDQGQLRIMDPERWYMREDGAFVCTADGGVGSVIGVDGSREEFEPSEWERDPAGTMRKKDGSRIIWSDGMQWSFADEDGSSGSP